MDLLAEAYATASDNDDDENVGGGGSEPSNPLSPPPKRARPETLLANPIHMPLFRAPSLHAEAPIPGRYISKRQRAALAADPKLNYVLPSPGSLLYSNSRPIKF